MSNFDQDWTGGSGAQQGPSGGWEDQAAPPSVKGGGGWHLLLSFVTLLGAAGVAFLAAWLSKDIPDRPWWMLGLIFMLPAMMTVLGAYIVESMTSAMTPRFNRRAQLLVALALTALTFITGSFARVLDPLAVSKAANYLFLMDRSSSMNANDAGNESKNAILKMIEPMGEESQIGLILFNHELIAEVPIAPLDDLQRSLIAQKLDIPADGFTNFDLPLTRALDMLEGAALQPGSAAKIIMVTDGEFAMTSGEEIVRRSITLDVPISSVKIAGIFDGNLTDVINKSGGMAVLVDQAAELTEGIASLKIQSFDVLRDSSSSAKIIAGALLIVEGLVLGLALTLMLSCHKQKRLQLLISPLMGAAAFVIIKLLDDAIEPAWLRELAAFSLFGIVLMRKNVTGQGQARIKPKAQVTESDAF